MCYLLSLLSVHNLLLKTFSFTLRAIDKKAILLGKLSPDDSPVGEPERMLLRNVQWI